MGNLEMNNLENNNHTLAEEWIAFVNYGFIKSTNDLKETFEDDVFYDDEINKNQLTEILNKLSALHIALDELLNKNFSYIGVNDNEIGKIYSEIYYIQKYVSVLTRNSGNYDVETVVKAAARFAEDVDFINKHTEILMKNFNLGRANDGGSIEDKQR